MKLDTLDISNALKAFNDVLGDAKPKIVNDIKALLGREEKAGEADAKKGIQVSLKDWKASAGFKLTRKTGESLQLPANNPASILLCFGMRMNELAANADCEMSCTIPKNCEEWVNKHKQNRKQVEAQVESVKA